MCDQHPLPAILIHYLIGITDLIGLPYIRLQDIRSEFSL
jgi:hypothetical protein